MRLAEYSVPKKNCAKEGELRYGSGSEPIFLSVEEVISNTTRRYAIGKILLLTDGDGYKFACSATRNARVICLVQEGDESLPLFAMPDTVVCVLAIGGEAVMRSARFFASVRSVACVLVSLQASLFGCYERRGRIRVDGEEGEFPLADGDVYCDPQRISNLSGGFARILLARLATVERHALCVFCENQEGWSHPADRCASLFQGEEAREIVNACCQIALAEREGGACGEGMALARLLSQSGERHAEWCAYIQLSALYSAFFAKGKARRYFVPDYSARCNRAGVGLEGYLQVRVPTVEESARRSLVLERTRKTFMNELNGLLCRIADDRRVFLALGGEVGRVEKLDCLKKLPEHSPHGLSAVIRDFGLLE